MAQSSRQQARQLLSKDELTLVETTHNPQSAELADSELVKIHQLLRERRDKAHQTADRQQREMRGVRAKRHAPPAGQHRDTPQKRSAGRSDPKARRRSEASGVKPVTGG
jgi:hypothetical protein